MPTPGQRAPQPCPTCGRPMEWKEDAIRRQTVRGTGTGFKEEERSTEAAYVCLLGHVSDKCPACGSRDTARAADGSTIKCNACGKQSALSA